MSIRPATPQANSPPIAGPFTTTIAVSQSSATAHQYLGTAANFTKLYVRDTGGTTLTPILPLAGDSA
jgi:hypothetical protein